MSRNISVRALYKNNVAINRGLFNGGNCDMVENPFDSKEVLLLFRRFKTEVGNKKVGPVTITVSLSDSMGKSISIQIVTDIDNLFLCIFSVAELLDKSVI